MVLSGANAAIFVAELENPYPTPPRITVSWEKATDVQKEKLNWFTVNGKKMAFGIYANRNKDNFEKYGAEVNLNIPICKYEEDHQCRFDCPIFGVCGENPC